jgi:hypothetical protein
VDANSITNSRAGTITVNGQAFTVNQAGGMGCPVVLNSTNASSGPAAGSGTFGVTTAASCSWSATANQTWIHTTSSGINDGTVTYTVDGNGTTSSRSGTIAVNGQVFSVSQAGATTVDGQAPTATFLAPRAGAVLSGPVTVQAWLTDNVSLASVEFYIDNATQWILVGTSACSGLASTNAMVLDTTTVLDGPHTVMCRPIDTAGNYSWAMLSVTVSNYPGQGETQWAKSIQGISIGNYGANSQGVAADRAGNSVSVGGFSGIVDLGAGPALSVGLGDAFVVKYNSQGGLLWLKQLGGIGDDVALGVAIDSLDNIIVVGGFHGTVNFGGATLTSAGGYDVFVVKYSPSGVLLWAKRFGGLWDEVGRAVALDTNNNILLATTLQSVNADFGGIPLTSVGYTDIALTKLSAAGATLWAKRWGSVNDEVPLAVAVDRLGNLWVTGQYWTATDVGGGLQTALAGNNGDGFVAKYSGADGSHLWSRVMGSPYSSLGRGLAADPNTGNVIITGDFRGTTDFGGGPVASGPSGTVFLTGYGASGNNLWARAWGGNNTSTGDVGTAVNVDAKGNLALTGQLYSPADLGGGLVGGGGYFVAAFTVSGNAPPVYKWARSASTSTGYGVAFDALGHLFSSGSFQYTMDFGGGLSATAPVGSTGAFVIQYLK